MRRLIFFLCFILLALPYSASAQQLPPVNPAEVSGNINIAGSSILEPVTNTLVTLFTLEGYSGTGSVNVNGTDTAFQQLCSGEVDIVMADRQILPQEVDACTAANRPPIAFRIASSAVVVVISPQNDFATSISSTELQTLFSTALNWSEVRGEWVTEPVDRFGSATDSAGFNLFTTVVFGGNRTPLATAIGAQYNNDQGGRLQAISTSRTAIGFFSANYALANLNVLRGVTIDNVAPTSETIANNTYPLSRPLLLYTTSQDFAEDEQVASFLNYYLTNFEREANASGLIPAPASSLEVARNRWLTASGQTSSSTVPTALPTLDPVVATATALASSVGGEPQASATESVEQPVLVETQPDVVPPTATPGASSAETFSTIIQNTLIQARLDLELVAETVAGGTRPEGWSGSLDITNPQLPLLIRLDLEILAARVYGLDSRPDDWFGPVSSTMDSIARDIRHDLEVLADDTIGTIRPAQWAGDAKIYSCDRSTQALATLLQKNGLYTLTADLNSPDYCRLVALEVSRFIEVNFLNTDVSFSEGGVSIPAEVRITSPLGVAFFDKGSTRAGLMPEGTGLEVIARSYQGFSNMTLVRGSGFLVFVEWQNTNLTQEEWRSLPDEADFEYTTTCTLFWCEQR